jgi:hypothetical protein
MTTPQTPQYADYVASFRCKHCAALIVPTGNGWKHVYSNKTACRDLMGRKCKAEPA